MEDERRLFTDKTSQEDRAEDTDNTKPRVVQVPGVLFMQLEIPELVGPTLDTTVPRASLESTLAEV